MARQPATGFVLSPWRLRREGLTLSEGQAWYLVQSVPGREFYAQFQLLAQDYKVFLPTLTKTIRHARKVSVTKAPVFSGYLFVILDLARDQWRSVNGTFGVARIVTFDGRPSPVPAGLVEAMLERTGPDGEMNLTQNLVQGQAVRILEGPFAQLVGTLDQLDAGGKVRVLLEIMGGVIPVLLTSRGLEPAT